MSTQMFCIGDHPGASGAAAGIPALEPPAPLTAKFDRLMADLEVRNAEVEQFVRTVSHDLKVPLITIKGFLALLKRDAATGDRELLADDIHQIGKAADRLIQQLDELFEYHRIGFQSQSPERAPLGALVHQAVDLASRELDADFVIAPDLPVVYGDVELLLQVFQHLLANAVRFMGDQASPRVEVGVCDHGDEMFCYVRDNGIGIEPHHHRRIFRIFRRLDTSIGGTGAGLALVKRIVEVHGGRIWVESEGLGKGSTFCFTLNWSQS